MHPAPAPLAKATATKLPSRRRAVACFAIDATAEPGTMPRVLAHFALRSLVPDRWHALRTEGDELQIDIQIAGLDAIEIDKLAAALRQIIDVRDVLVTMK